MTEEILDKNWKMKSLTDREFLETTVPGSVYQTYLAHGKMEDPFYRDNEEKALELMKEDFEFITEFEVSDELLASDEILLHFDGIDTLGDISLNGRHLGKTDNMHRIWEFDVTDTVKKQGNLLRIILFSPVNYIYDSYEQDPASSDCSDAMRGCSRLRKAHCMFGWDWGPRLPDAGIFRNVKLLGIQDARIDNVYITQKHEKNCVTLSIQAEAVRAFGEIPFSPGSSDGDSEQYCYRVTITDPEGTAQTYDNSPAQILVENPKLWWPNGYGEQPLYRIRLELFRGQQLLDVWDRRIGLRTATVARKKDEWGESFAHEVNGVCIFAMGADYIPEDNVLPRVTPERTRRLLTQARDAHFNCIRVWGGGYYPDDAFYDICDELGLLVWQDFMFACCTYDLTKAFEESITAEFIDNIKRIRHHACLGLWCGNNEMEMFLAENVSGWCKKPGQLSDYFKMYEYIIPKVLEKYDPQTFYWPASPSSGGGFDAPNDENRGDVHYWDVWHGDKPITEFRKFYFRYLSEFGFQSFPALKTVETFTLPEDRNIFSYVMEKHQRNQSANGKIMNYLGQTYLYPADFGTLLYASQLLQAEAMRYGVEHFRRHRGRCMGTLIWQLNDCWPTASWSMIDYEGRWKAVQYYAKRFFAPLLISCEEEGTLTQNTNVNAEPFTLRKSVTLCASNETTQDQAAEIGWQLRHADGTCIREYREKAVIPALSSCWFQKTELPEARIHEEYVSYEMTVDGEIVSAGSVLFCAPKHFHFTDPHLRVEMAEEGILKIYASSFAKSVEIKNGDDTLLLEDNYFDMNPGCRSIRVLEGKPENLQVRSVYDIR